MGQEVKREPYRASLPESAVSGKRFDPHSETWAFVKEFCAKRLKEMRELNDSDLSDTRTAALRGKINFAKEILDLEKPKPDIVKPEEIL
jgi:hypothetical protein